MREKTDYEENRQRRILMQKYIDEVGVIDDAFIEKYCSKVAQSKIIFDGAEGLGEAVFMNGLAGIDCSKVDFSNLSKENYLRLPFGSNTKFPESVKGEFDKILENGKKFGQGFEELITDEKLSAKGLNVALIDESFNPDSISADDINIVEFIGDKTEDHYHGKTTASLLASKSCGLAKGADVHFFQSINKNRSNDTSFERIIEHNKNCKNEEDKILVCSGSWSLKGKGEFEKWQGLLREAGCELVCQNNFIQNFTETVANDNILEFSDDEKTLLSDNAKNILSRLDLSDKVSFPIDRTYHEFGEEGKESGFKYQPNFSNSWGIPQMAGLFVMYKMKDKSLTFDDFTSLAKETAKGDNNTINPEGIYEKVLDRLRSKQGLIFDDIKSLAQNEDVMLEKDTSDASLKDYKSIQEVKENGKDDKDDNRGRSLYTFNGKM